MFLHSVNQIRSFQPFVGVTSRRRVSCCVGEMSRNSTPFSAFNRSFNQVNPSFPHSEAATACRILPTAVLRIILSPTNVQTTKVLTEKRTHSRVPLCLRLSPACASCYQQQDTDTQLEKFFKRLKGSLKDTEHQTIKELLENSCLPDSLWHAILGTWDSY